MTREETLRILAVLRAAYPNFYKGMEREELQSIAALWQEMFLEDEYAVVALAAKALIASSSSGYPPVIGQIKEKIRLLRSPKAMCGEEAWSLVRRALSNGLYGSREEFAKLPEGIQELVGSPAALRCWAAMDVGEVETVIKSQFLKGYREKQEYKKQVDALPESVRRQIGPGKKEKQLRGRGAEENEKGEEQ